MVVLRRWRTRRSIGVAVDRAIPRRRWCARAARGVETRRHAVDARLVERVGGQTALSRARCRDCVLWRDGAEDADRRGSFARILAADRPGGPLHQKASVEEAGKEVGRRAIADVAQCRWRARAEFRGARHIEREARHRQHERPLRKRRRHLRRRRRFRTWRRPERVACIAEWRGFELFAEAVCRLRRRQVQPRMEVRSWPPAETSRNAPSPWCPERGRRAFAPKAS